MVVVSGGEVDKELSRVMEMFQILIGLWVTWV